MNEGGFAQARAGMADGMARICRVYGVSPLLGRLYTELFLAPAPLALDELCERVGAAKSSVSVALRTLERAKVAKRLPPKSDRRDYYEGITDPWTILADWTAQYFQPELDMFKETGAQLRAALAEATDAPTGDDAKRLVARLDAFAEMADVMATMIAGLDRRGAAPAASARRIPIEVDS